ncbi:putative manganese transporter [Vibrio methylphosphonaticus]|uniref:putative manganese transporter n=1 Tax=Vibrio methylphosphonaticus TaxID=2946866 RepID=UPI00202A2C42|nr:putative manganese transporter [Vibrio methylphosphonaticus]MCL9774443.1 putative manganese transporter [Vibrio methylphosphonaticus]
MEQTRRIRGLYGLSLSQFKPAYKRLLLPITMIALLLSKPTSLIAVSALSDAYWAVSCYVVFTLAVYHYISRLLSQKNALVELYQQSPNHQVVFSSLLGALPGCGGAIIVTTQFVAGKVGFGSVVAVLTATMGDAAFLILASKPSVGFGLIAVGVVVGMVTGFIVNAIHRPDFLRPKITEFVQTFTSTPVQSHAGNEKLTRSFEEPSTFDKQCHCSKHGNAHRQDDHLHSNHHQNNPVNNMAINLQGLFWKWLMIPSLLIAFTLSFQIDVNALLGLSPLTIEWTGAILAVVTMSLWAFTKEIVDYESTVGEDKKLATSHPMQKAAQDTHFVSAWVIVAFLAFEITLHFSQVDLSHSFSGWGIYMPLLGVLVGLLPGCGPQILITSLYLTGAVPMSTQLSNAISNDGDALFPAIAMAPKAALVATFYSALPALITGYSYYWIFEI